MIIKRGLFPGIIVLLLLAACRAGVETSGGNSGIEARAVNDSRITGVYYLAEVDGVEIPGTVLHGGHEVMISWGTFTIGTDGTCTSTTVFAPPRGQAMTRTVRAKYVEGESRLIMKWEGAGITEGVVEGDIFTMDNHGMIFEYSRNPS